MRYAYSGIGAAALTAMLLWVPAHAAQVVTDALDRPAAMAVDAAQSMLLGMAQAGARIVAVGERGIILLSDDAGAHWRQINSPVSTTLTAVRFADARHGWAAGHGGVVLATQDGGERWALVLDGRGLARQLQEAARTRHDPAALRSAERLVAEGPDKPFLDLLVLDVQRLLAVGAYGLAFFSEDGGRNWVSWQERLPNPAQMHIYAARRYGKTWLLAGEQGLAMVSTDDGRTFQRLTTPYKGSFFTAELLDSEQDMVLAGLRGNAWRSRDGGGSWQSIASPMPVSITATALDGGGRLLAANQAGFVLALSEDRLTPLNTIPLPPLNDVLVDAQQSMLVLSRQGVHELSGQKENLK